MSKNVYKYNQLKWIIYNFYKNEKYRELFNKPIDLAICFEKKNQMPRSSRLSNSSILIIEALSTMLSGGGMMLTQFTPPVNMGDILSVGI